MAGVPGMTGFAGFARFSASLVLVSPVSVAGPIIGSAGRLGHGFIDLKKAGRNVGQTGSSQTGQDSTAADRVFFLVHDVPPLVVHVSGPVRNPLSICVKTTTAWGAIHAILKASLP